MNFSCASISILLLISKTNKNVWSQETRLLSLLVLYSMKVSSWTSCFQVKQSSQRTDDWLLAANTTKACWIGESPWRVTHKGVNNFLNHSHYFRRSYFSSLWPTLPPICNRALSMKTWLTNPVKKRKCNQQNKTNCQKFKAGGYFFYNIIWVPASPFCLYNFWEISSWKKIQESKEEFGNKKGGISWEHLGNGIFRLVWPETIVAFTQHWREMQSKQSNITRSMVLATGYIHLSLETLLRVSSCLSDNKRTYSKNKSKLRGWGSPRELYYIFNFWCQLDRAQSAPLHTCSKLDLSEFLHPSLKNDYYRVLPVAVINTLAKKQLMGSRGLFHFTNPGYTPSP